MKPIALFSSLFIAFALNAQLYFPPNGFNATWDTVAPASLGWCVDSIQPLYDHLQTRNSKAFIVLKDGKIVMEKYFDTFTKDSLWYWASAGKTMTSFLTGIAQSDGLIDINQPTSTYLGTGWTSLSPAQEQQITVLNQLTMTSGLDDSGNSDCTDAVCLNYLADPDTRWAYHNAPYTLLTSVIENTSGQTINSFLFQKLTGTTGLFATYVQVAYNRVVFSTARSFARFGLLNLAGGVWNGTPILNDPAYVQAMSTPSQTINNSYGYLWWLNGQADHMLPGFQLVIPGSTVPSGPPDMYCGIGKNDQLLCVVPSENLVLIRMGNAASSSLVPISLLREIWDHMNAIRCNTTSTPELNDEQMVAYPNPSSGSITLQWPASPPQQGQLTITDITGRHVSANVKSLDQTSMELNGLVPGQYIASFVGSDQERLNTRFIVQ